MILYSQECIFIFGLANGSYLFILIVEVPMSDLASSAGLKSSASSLATRARYVFWVMFAISFLNYLDRFVLTGGANTIAKELGFDLSGVGYISSAFLVVYTLGTLPIGMLADVMKRKNLVAICVAIWSVATMLTSLTNNFITLFLSRMVLGIGEAGYFPAGTALMSDYFNRERRSRIMSWWSTAQLFGILGGYGLGGVLAGLYLGSWRWAFIITGVPGLVLAFLIWRAHEPRRNQADEEAAAMLSQTHDSVGEIREVAHAGDAASVSSRSRGMLAQWLGLFRVKTLFVLIFMQIFAYFVIGVNTTFLPIYLQQKDTFGLSSGLAGLYAGGVIVVAGVAGTVIGGYTADFLNRRHQGARVLVCGIGFLLSAPSFAIVVTYHNLAIFTGFFILTTLLLTVYTGPSTAATQDVVPSRVRASALALSLLIAHLFGDAAAPSIVGVLATVIDPTHGGHFRLGLAGQDLSYALLVTCVPALIVAGLVGILGARWMAADVAAAERVDRLAKL
jgi:MFS family permease